MKAYGPLVKIDEAADFLHLSAATVYKLTRRELIPCVRLGNTLRFSLRGLEEWIANTSWDNWRN